MKRETTSTLWTIGSISLVSLLALNIVRTGYASSPQVAAATAHFNPGKTYVLRPASGTGPLRCKVIDVDGAWIKCEDEKLQWMNTNVMMFASDIP